MLKDRLHIVNEFIEKMGNINSSMIDILIKSIAHNDNQNELKRLIDELEPQVDDLELEITQLSISSLALFQPEAKFLRLIISTIEINHSLERMSDIFVNIAERLIKMTNSEVIFKEHFCKMLRCTQEMLANSIKAFLAGDEALAKSIIPQDDLVDNLRDTILKDIIKIMKEEDDEITNGVFLAITAQNIERVADMCISIAKNVIYMVSGHSKTTREFNKK